MTDQRKLALHDIADLRAYERERAGYRRRIIELKKRRRVRVGPFVSLVFENRDTIRFQIQEMARAERLITDAEIQGEIDTYNSLIPEAGQLCATLFIELTDAAQMREWLPKLVGIERSGALRAGSDEGARLLRAEPEAAHAAQLTRDEVTAAVHYVHWEISARDVDVVATGPVTLLIDHPNYQEATLLDEATVAEVLADLRG